MKYIRTMACLVVLLIFMASMVSAAVVTVDLPGKTAKSDSAILDPIGLDVQGDQAGLFIKSTVSEAQTFVLKFAGLKDESYDIYINKAFTGTKPAKDLEQGIIMNLPGTICDPGMMRCLNAVKGSIAAAHSLMSKSPDPEAQRISFTLSQAEEWVGVSLKKEQSYRGCDVIIVPSGMVLREMTWGTRMDAEGTANAVTRACWYLQQARSQMYRVIVNTTLRNEAVTAMTPVEFTANYGTKNGKPHVEAKVVNSCDLPISGNITFALPAGWKTNAKKLAFNALKSGQSFSIAFDLISPSKSAAAPESVPIAVNVTVTQDDQTAGMKLRLVARKDPSLTGD